MGLFQVHACFSGDPALARSPGAWQVWLVSGKAYFLAGRGQSPRRTARAEPLKIFLSSFSSHRSHNPFQSFSLLINIFVYTILLKHARNNSSPFGSSRQAGPCPTAVAVGPVARLGHRSIVRRTAGSGHHQPCHLGGCTGPSAAWRARVHGLGPQEGRTDEVMSGHVVSKRKEGSNTVHVMT